MVIDGNKKKLEMSHYIAISIVLVNMYAYQKTFRTFPKQIIILN